jgi:hypothetical protein
VAIHMYDRLKAKVQTEAVVVQQVEETENEKRLKKLRNRGKTIYGLPIPLTLEEAIEEEFIEFIAKFDFDAIKK